MSGTCQASEGVCRSDKMKVQDERYESGTFSCPRSGKDSRMLVSLVNKNRLLLAGWAVGHRSADISEAPILTLPT
jgi:hypothetical protein